MAYVVYFACDSCGREGGTWVNRTVSLSIASGIAREYGWKVGKKGWICPYCQKEKQKRRNKT